MKYIKYSCFGIHNVNHIIVSKCKLSTGCPAETTYDLPYACHTINHPKQAHFSNSIPLPHPQQDKIPLKSARLNSSFLH